MTGTDIGGSEVETDAPEQVSTLPLRSVPARGFGGEVLRPGDPAYEAHRRVWNGSIDRRPAAVLRCTGTSDVQTAIALARDRGHSLAVRGGGHSFPGHSTCTGGIVADLSPMKRLAIDLERRTVRVQPGVLIGELDAATQKHGLVVPAGIVTHTGVAGLTLGGGLGWLMRRHGLTIDSLLSVELVTADGELLRASAAENADLFWGVRGGGGNFGVVTDFEFRMRDLDPVVLAGPIFWPISESPRVLRFYRDWVAEAPDELGTIVVHRKAPDLPFVPVELRGRLVVAVVCCYSGPSELGERLLRPLRQVAPPAVDLCRPTLFLEHQAMFDASFPHGWWYYWRACEVGALTDAVIDITVDHSEQIRSSLTSFPIWHLGGAASRVPAEGTGYGARSEGFAFNIGGVTRDSEGFEEEVAWVRRFWTALSPFHEGVYVNFLMDEGEQRIRAAYGDPQLSRLRSLKRKYDPDNLFRLNQNITP